MQASFVPWNNTETVCVNAQYIHQFEQESALSHWSRTTYHWGGLVRTEVVSEVREPAEVEVHRVVTLRDNGTVQSVNVVQLTLQPNYLAEERRDGLIITLSNLHPPNIANFRILSPTESDIVYVFQAEEYLLITCLTFTTL